MTVGVDRHRCEAPYDVSRRRHNGRAAQRKENQRELQVLTGRYGDVVKHATVTCGLRIGDAGQKLRRDDSRCLVVGQFEF